MAEINFSHQNLSDGQSTMLIGTSPELEMSLYTLCFLVHPDSICPVQLGGVNLKLQVIGRGSFTKNHKSNVIESASWSF